MNNMNWRTRAFIISGIVGAALGVSAAYIYINSVEKNGREPSLQPKEAVGIGLSLLALLRQIATLHEGDAGGKRKLR